MNSSSLGFPVRLRAASIIPRWSIIHTIKPDYLSSHSFFVAVYVRQIALMIDWQGDMGALLWAALSHDVREELITGDLVSPVKREIVQPSVVEEFISKKQQEVLPGIEFMAPHGNVKCIVKAADQLDALLYALGEMCLGNRIIAARIPSCKDKLREAWFCLPAHESHLHLLWDTIIQETINQHSDPSFYDIGK